MVMHMSQSEERRSQTPVTGSSCIIWNRQEQERHRALQISAFQHQNWMWGQGGGSHISSSIRRLLNRLANSEPQDKMRAIPHRSSPLPSCSPCLPRCGAVRGLGAPVMAALYIAAVRWTDGRQNELGNGSPESKICTENTRHHQTSQQPSGVSQQRPKSQERMLLEKGYCSSALTPEYVSRLCFFSFYKHPLWLHS
ncbi:uncharacterized protein LOC121678249 isoform X3 [Alosa sapidissima]|uniref:uncharacterized protein LOC121678249 isoform X3 n=1 Tax=Alosa sapidissima TaxID=34773 RepID=UPI001C0A2018|nr:uncharacterized protein LOC121678249 isoform X3 [Alosa sapidissima]